MDETKTGHVFKKVDIKDEGMLFMICCMTVPHLMSHWVPPYLYSSKSGLAGR